MLYRSFLLMLFILLSVSTNFAINWPLKVSYNGKFIEDKDNIPFFLVGESAWTLFQQLNYDSAKIYLDDRKSKGVNALLVMLMVADGYGSNAPINQYGQAPFNTIGDFDTPNEYYFAMVDSILNMMKSRGMCAILTPSYLGYNCGSQGWSKEIIEEGPEGMGRWGAYLGRRYKDQNNIIWLGGGDADQSRCQTTAEFNALFDSLLFYDEDGICAAHSYRGRSAFDDYSQNWLDINTTYSNENSYEAESLVSFKQMLPAFYIEGRYEDEGASDEDLLGQMYFPVLYGQHVGSIYGHGEIWPFSKNWAMKLNDEGAKYLESFGKLFKSRPFWKLIPDHAHNVIVDNYTNAEAITNDSSCIIAYAYDDRTLKVNMENVRDSRAKAWWYNPETGDTTFIGIFNTSGSQDFKTNGTNVLVIDGASMNFPAPGKGIYQESQNSKPPFVSNPIADIYVYEDAENSLINLSKVFSDPDIDDNKILKTIDKNTNTDLVHISINDDSLKLIYQTNQFGESRIVINGISDGQTTKDTFLVTVYPVNDPPHFKNLPDSLELHKNSQVEIQLYEYITDYDLPNDSLRWSFTIFPEEVILDYHIESRTLTLINEQYSGSSILKIEVIDDSLASVKDSIRIISKENETAINKNNRTIPIELVLFQNYPNPFNPFTHITVGIPESIKIEIDLLDIHGRQIKSIYNGPKLPGVYTFKFNAFDLPTGIYFYRLKTQKRQITKKMILLK